MAQRVVSGIFQCYSTFHFNTIHKRDATDTVEEEYKDIMLRVKKNTLYNILIKSLQTLQINAHCGQLQGDVNTSQM